MASILIQLISSLLLFCLVFGMTATVEVSQMKKQVYNYKALWIGIIIQFILLPFVGFVMVLLFQLPIEIGITLLVITSSPGGSYSNWWCSMFNADLALSVTMTALSTILATVMLPINLFIYTKYIYTSSVLQSLDWMALLISLIVVLSGIASGLYISHYTTMKVKQQQQQQQQEKNIIILNQPPQNSNDDHFSPTENTKSRSSSSTSSNIISIEDMHRNANRMGNISGLALILLSITVSSSHQDARIWDQSISFYMGCTLPPICGLLFAIILTSYFCHLDKPERVAVSIESCYQNTGIATTVALTMFHTEQELATAIGVPLYYGIVEAVLIFTFCIICWKCGWTKAPPNESIIKVITTSYEVEHHNSNGPDEKTAIEIIFGGDDGDDATISGTRRMERRGKYVDLIFTKQTENGDYIVDDHTLQQQEEIEMTERKKTLAPPAPHSLNVTSSPTVTEVSDDEMTIISADDNNNNNTNNSNKTMILIDQLRMESRLGKSSSSGRKTLSNIRAFATGYRNPLPFIYDDGDTSENDIEGVVHGCQGSVQVESSLAPFHSDLSVVDNAAIGNISTDSQVNKTTTVSLDTQIATIDDDSLILSSNSSNTTSTIGRLRRRIQYETISNGYGSPRNENSDNDVRMQVVEPADTISNEDDSQTLK